MQPGVRTAGTSPVCLQIVVLVHSPVSPCPAGCSLTPTQVSPHLHWCPHGHPNVLLPARRAQPRAAARTEGHVVGVELYLGPQLAASTESIHSRSLVTRAYTPGVEVEQVLLPHETMPTSVQAPSFWHTSGPPESPCGQRGEDAGTEPGGPRARGGGGSGAALWGTGHPPCRRRIRRPRRTPSRRRCGSPSTACTARW